MILEFFWIDNNIQRISVINQSIPTNLQTKFKFKFYVI